MLDPHEIHQIARDAIIFGAIMSALVGSLIGIASYSNRR